MRVVFIAILFCFLACSNGENKVSGFEKTKKENEWHNNKGVNQSLERLLDKVVMLVIRNDQNQIEISKPLERRVNAFMVGSLGGFKIADEICLLFYLKLYKAELDGNKNIADATCCLSSSSILAPFLFHFYKLSDFDPTIGLMLEDIYSWICLNKTVVSSSKISNLIDEITQSRLLFNEE